ncbi:MAG: glutaredoxin 3 [Alphaproteobacteria bacterium]|nr:glutaredoxin 3 [Alphaproteobacteria bacterium]
MANVEIYTTMMCGFCARAKNLLKSKLIDFDEIDVTFSDSKRQAMMARSDGRHTVPQIFINGSGIGGCDELLSLEREGRLDDLLSAPAP